jgi:hypothetical protein
MLVSTTTLARRSGAITKAVLVPCWPPVCPLLQQPVASLRFFPTPAESVWIVRAMGGLERSPHQVAAASANQLVIQNRNLESGPIFCGGKPARHRGFCSSSRGNRHCAPGSTFDHAADESVSPSGVVERFAGLRYKGIIFERIQPCLDGIVKVFRVADFGVILRTGFVMASPRPGAREPGGWK